MSTRSHRAIRGNRRRLPAVASALLASLLVHAAVLGAALALGTGVDSPGPPRLVLVDLPPAPVSSDEARVMPAERREEPSAVEAMARRVEALTEDNAGMAAALADAQRRTAQLEAEHRRELTALESATARLGERVAALAADRSALAAEVERQRRRNTELEQALAARREAEAEALAEVTATHERLVSALQREIADRDIALEQGHQGLTVAITDRVLFPSGQATLTPDGLPVIDKIGAALAAMPGRAVLVEGHTDDVPIGAELRAQFPSNWELSAARAAEVVERLIEQAHVPRARLRAVGRADTEPVASNDTEEGRRRNRRIEIIILPPPAVAPARVPS